MKLVRAASALSTSVAACLSMLVAVDAANAGTTLNVTSTSVVYPTSPAVTAGLHLTSPAVNYSAVYVSPQYLNGTLDGNSVKIFAYCVDILSESGPGTFTIVPLLDYLSGNVAKYNELAWLIGSAGGPVDKYSDAATQAAVWELMYDNSPSDISAGNLLLNNIHNDASLVSTANTLVGQAVANSGTSSTGLQLFVAKNSDRQDMLFWMPSPVPEPGTWALMLVGFGFVGGAVRWARRREKLQPTAA